MVEKYASPEDYELCRNIHRRFGTTYYMATQRLPSRQRKRVHALYAFVRVPDEWVDNPGNLSPAAQRENLKQWEEEFLAGLSGTRPSHPVLRAFCDTFVECRMPIAEVEAFLEAMWMDLDTTCYETYEDLRRYMNGSASAIGVLMCYAICARTDPDTLSRARALGEAMQLTNFLRDIGEDLDRGRIYLPREDMRMFGLSERDLTGRLPSPALKALIEYEIARARRLYAYADFGIHKLPPAMRPGIFAARILYARILNRIEDQHCDVFTRRARTSAFEKLRVLASIYLSGPQVLSLPPDK